VKFNYQKPFRYDNQGEPRVEIIILNWNKWKDTIECLESVYNINYSNYEIIIVDNGSKNESIEMIRAYCRGKLDANLKEDSGNKPIEIVEYKREEAISYEIKNKEILNLPSNKKLIMIKNEKNYGFADGNNIAIGYALKAIDPNYILLLNNDVVVDKDFLGQLVRVAESDETIGIVGPKVYYYDFKGRKDIINFAGGKLDIWKGQSYHIGLNEADDGQYDEIRNVDYVEGSALLVKRDALKRIGFIDSIYFAYWEEVDFCMRALDAGYRLKYVPKSKIWHKVSSSVDNTTKTFYLTRNRFIFARKYSNKKQYLAFLLYFFGFQFWLLGGIYLISHKDLNTFIHFLKGILYGILLTDSKPVHHH